MKLKSLLALLGCLLLIAGVSVTTILSQDGADEPQIVVEANVESIPGAPSTDENVDELVTVDFEDVNGNPITSVVRGTPFVVWAHWSTPINGFKVAYIGLITWSGGKNTVIVSRTGDISNVVGVGTFVVAPSWATTGPVTFIVSVQNRGVGFGSITLY